MKTAVASFLLAFPTYIVLVFSEQTQDLPVEILTVALPLAAVLGFFGLGLAAFAQDIPGRERRLVGLLSLPSLIAVGIIVFMLIARAAPT